MKIGVIGINHKLANLQLREKMAQACQRCFMAGVSIYDNHTFILLNTCNRTEIYFSSENLTEAHSYLLNRLRVEVNEEFDQKVYSYFGYDCFLHLSRVTAGLDSAIVAETEIQGQVKTAYEKAVNCMSLPKELHYLFQKGLQTGKKVRSELCMGRGVPDLEHAVYQTGMHFFSHVENPSILFVGASEVNVKILSFLKSKHLQKLTLCNRSQKHSQMLSEQNGVSLLKWEDLALWTRFDWVILGTKAPYHLLRQKDLSDTVLDRKLIMDLSVPRNVEPMIGKDRRITLLNIDQINRILKVRKQRMVHVLSQAEEMISHSSKQYVELFYEKNRLQVVF